MTDTRLTAAPRPLIAGNWKMNGQRDSGGNELGRLVARCAGQAGLPEILICPPATLIAALAAAARGTPVAIGAQDCHPKASGAHTGDISAAMINEAGATHVIVGHSERRADHGETDAVVRAKAQAALDAGLVAIVCVGETLAERDGGQAVTVVERQLAQSLPDGASAANCVVAYEPVWAIGTGRTPTTDQVAEIHRAIRDRLVARFADGQGFRILYGGSVKGSNAAELMAVSNVDGALVGGASLKADDFWPIVAAKLQ